MIRSRTIRTRHGGILRLPDVEAQGITGLGSWVARSDIPGTRPWEWVITNMPVTAVTGMSSGYCLTRWGARRAAWRALAFWESYEYPISPDGVRVADWSPFKNGQLAITFVDDPLWKRLRAKLLRQQLWHRLAAFTEEGL